MKTILLVDDDAFLRTVLSIFLTRAGFRVVEAGDGLEALKLFKAHPADLVITDLIMPEKEGLELIMNLRKGYPHLRIIAMSGGGFNSPADYLSIAKALGACHILSKPFLNEELLAAVQSILG